ncbi:Dihydroorotase [hydrothermal vent metagenome]|uniref:Dihydroorotase n=1 Tax=hydrothermal vent metagenome TaxID=652676 RepID=A0A3B0SVN0_9ZZZZ
MDSVLIVGGSVLASTGVVSADVLIVGDRIERIGEGIKDETARVIDASGSWVGPGFVDVHTHLREPGQEWKEDIATGSAAGAAGGYTALVAMPNTDPVIDSGHLARFITGRGEEAGLVQVIPAGTLTMGRRGEQLAHLDDLWAAGVRMFSDDGDTVADAGLLRRAMEYIAQLGGVVSEHAIDPGLARGGHMHEGTVSSRLGMTGIPAIAEVSIIARDLALVELTGVTYHLQHVSTRGAVELLAAAKDRGLPVTAEVTPHHLAFDHQAAAATDASYKVMPPLRESDDVVAVREALASGTIDMVATDHAPHASHEKDVPFEHAPFGVTGLEWAAAVVNSVDGLGLDQETFFDRMSISPAALLGLADQGVPLTEGAVANVVVFDPRATWSPTETLSKSRNAPYFGKDYKGRVTTTLYRGAFTYEMESGR